MNAAITGGILAGGESSRFGSDKAWALFDGRPLIVHLLEQLRAQVGSVLISANHELPRYEGLGCAVVTDTIGAGPLAGIAALLAGCMTDWLLVVPCDALVIPADWADRCLQQALASDAEAVVLDDGERLHPTFCLVQRSLLPRVETALNAGQYGLQRWLLGTRVQRLRGPAPLNLNTPAALEQLRTGRVRSAPI